MCVLDMSNSSQPSGLEPPRLLCQWQEYWSGRVSSFRGSSGSRGQTCISYIGRWALYHRTTWEALIKLHPLLSRPPLCLSGKESVSNAGNAGALSLIAGLGRSPGGGNGIPLQYSCLGDLMDGGAW